MVTRKTFRNSTQMVTEGQCPTRNPGAMKPAVASHYPIDITTVTDKNTVQCKDNSVQCEFCMNTMRVPIFAVSSMTSATFISCSQVYICFYYCFVFVFSFPLSSLVFMASVCYVSCVCFKFIMMCILYISSLCSWSLVFLLLLCSSFSPSSYFTDVKFFN